MKPEIVNVFYYLFDINTKFTLADARVFHWFKENRNKEGKAFYIPSEISSDLGVTRKTVIVRTKRLIELGALTKLSNQRVKVNV